MKNYFIVLALIVVVTSCKEPVGEAIDLPTGKTIQVIKDEEKGYMINAETKQPVYLYVTKGDKDTFYGRTAAKVNNNIIKSSSGSYRYTGDSEYVFSNGTYKIKTEADPYDYDDNKVSNNEPEKYKVQGDGDVKIKDGDYKAKVEAEGDIKIKDGEEKIKIKDGEVVKYKKD